jgi:uncharacterized protein DUF3224
VTRPTTLLAAVLAALAAGVAMPTTAPAETPAAKPPAAPAAPPQEPGAISRANGTFEVTLTPEASDKPEQGTALARMTIEKTYHGDLEATAKGEILTAVTGVEGSAGYVAIERVSGTLHGRRGTFVLLHSGTMSRGQPELRVTVVPDSGTGELAGLSGSMAILIADGKHSYALAYALGDAPSP